MKDVPSRRLFLAGAACCAVPSIGIARSLQRLSVSTAPVDSGMTPVIAQRAGFYRRYGLDVDIVEMNSGAAVAGAVVGGTVQIGSSSLMGLIAAHLKGIPFQIVTPGAIYYREKPNALLIVRKDSPIKTGADCNGKIIASPALNDLLSVTTMAWVDQHGGDSKTVHQVELPPVATPAALEAGRVDAATMAEPWDSEVLKAGNARVLGNPSDVIGPKYLISAFFALPEVINANHDAVEQLARAHHEANAFGNAHPDQTAPWLANLVNLDVTSVLHSNRASFAEVLSIADIQPMVDAAARYRVIERSFDARELISPVVLNLRLS